MRRLAASGMLLLLAVLLCAKTPVGIRGNNPCNIHGIHWRSWRGAVSSDGYHYLRFATPFYGLRAASRILDSYHREGIENIAGVCNRWVRHPSTEAQMESFRDYVLCVSQKAGYEPNQPIDTSSPQVKMRLLPAIVFAENGQQPYQMQLYAAAISKDQPPDHLGSAEHQGGTP